MKKKSPRGIPDFSRRPVPAKGGAVPNAPKKSESHGTPRPTAKPQATSSKAGRRGQ